MTVSAAFPTPLPQGAAHGALNGSGEMPGAEPEPQEVAPNVVPTERPAVRVVPVEALTIEEVYGYFLAHRAAVHASLEEHRLAGAPLNVPYDAVFLCELAGLVVDLDTGLVDGLADGLVVPIPALRSRLAGAGFAVDGEVVVVGSVTAPE